MTRKVGRTESGTFARAMTCDQCEIIRINGIPTHELGCPAAWMDYEVECKWCGREFFPEERHQEFCDSSCYASYMGLSCDEDVLEDEECTFDS